VGGAPISTNFLQEDVPNNAVTINAFLRKSLYVRFIIF
jgi:hypothetical protein